MATQAHKVIPIAVIGGGEEDALYEVRKKIYPRAVTGRFASARIAIVLLTQAIFYGLPWLHWSGRQAVLFDLGARKFYIFGLVFWPQDFIYLAILLVISALSLFLFTAVAGRLFCGYACPQTVYTEIFTWIERSIEGTRPQQMKLDSGELSMEKLLKKCFKHYVWIALALWTGFTFVGYFSPIRDLMLAFLQTQLGPWETFWILFYAFATYGNAGWMREQVCKYMCPYARFQSVMFDRDTLVITYDAARGEPRGARSRKADLAASGLGHCVDCNICVQVCPTGIDIRQGLQYECIGCAACIDGCDQVMDKMGYPKGLIRYTTENALEHKVSEKNLLLRVFRPRVLVYTAILGAIIVTAAVAMYMRVPIKVNVLHDRATLSRETDEGKIENVYRLQVMNTDETRRHFTVSVEGATGLEHIEVVGEAQPMEIGPASSRIIPLRVRAKVDQEHRGTTPIRFLIEASDDQQRPRPEIFSVREKSVFIAPR